MKYEVCIVSREYRWIEIDALDQNDAVDKAWDKVARGFTCDVKAQDRDTDVYVEGLAE